MLAFALQNLLSRPLRSLLALLGLTVAIVGMVGLFSIAGGLDQMVTSTFGRIPGLVAMQPGAPIPLFSRLPLSWADEIAALPRVRAVQKEIWIRAHVIEGEMVVSPPRFLMGIEVATAVLLNDNIYRDEIIEGRFLGPEDAGTLNVVISRSIAEEFGKGVGDILRVDGTDMPIVGVYHIGSLLLDVAIILDIEQVRTIGRFDPESVSSFYIELEPGADDEAVVASIHAAFAGRELDPWQPAAIAMNENPVAAFAEALDRMLKSAAPEEAGEVTEPTAVERPPATSDTHRESGSKHPHGEFEDEVLEIRTAADWGERFEKFSEDLNIFLMLMTGIGVVIAVLSILNTMLMSVSERLVEFGILKANGWGRGDIMKLITFESALLGFSGGVLGAILGWAATHAVNWYFPERVHLFASPGLLTFSLLFSTALGILGGLYPALWATRMTPMDAIRRG